jgi:hypothetical protein
LGKRRAKRSRKVRSPLSMRTPAPSQLIGAVRTLAATSDIAHLKMERPPKVPRAAVPFHFLLPVPTTETRLQGQRITNTQ